MGELQRNEIVKLDPGTRCVFGAPLVLRVRDTEGNKALSLYPAVADTSGKTATTTCPDPALVTKVQWTEWRIPLSSFTGVNVTKSKKLSLGAGGRKAPGPGGSGRIYIDDIRLINR